MASALYEKTLRDWGTEIKDKDATGEEIIEIGRSIVRPYYIKHLQTTLAGQERNISRIVDLSLGEAIKGDTKDTPKEGEGPANRSDFLTEVSRLKKIDMVKARAFYDAWSEKFKGTSD